MKPRRILLVTRSCGRLTETTVPNRPNLPASDSSVAEGGRLLTYRVVLTAIPSELRVRDAAVGVLPIALVACPIVSREVDVRVARNAKRHTGAAVVVETALAAPSRARGIEISVGRNQSGERKRLRFVRTRGCISTDRRRRRAARSPARRARYRRGRLRESRVRSASPGRTTSPPRTRSPALGWRRRRCPPCFPIALLAVPAAPVGCCRPRTRARESPAPRKRCRAFDRAAAHSKSLPNALRCAFAGTTTAVQVLPVWR